MTVPELKAEPSRFKTTLPTDGAGQPDPQRPETAMSADAQRGIEDCESTIRDCRVTIQDAQVRLERAIERRTRLAGAQHLIGVTYGE